MAIHSGPPGVAVVPGQDWALVPYRQSTAASLEEAQASSEEAASQAQEPSPAAAQASSAADLTGIPCPSRSLPLVPGQFPTLRPIDRGTW
jgi:hypothetical protein